MVDGLPYHEVENSSDIAQFRLKCASGVGKFVRGRHAFNSQRLRKCAAVSATHYRIHKAQSKNDSCSGYVVLEDDAYFIQPNCDLICSEWPRDGVTLLACCLSYLPYSRRDAKKSFHAKLPSIERKIEASARTKRSMEIDYQSYGWWGAFAYFVPSQEVARQISQYIDSLASIHNFDLQMSLHGKKAAASKNPNEKPIFRYLATPALCYMNDHGVSTIGNNIVGSSRNHVFVPASKNS